MTEQFSLFRRHLKWFVLGSLVLLAAAFFSLYGARAWIRGTVVPNYAMQHYLPTIDAAFPKVFSPVNEKLRPLGLTVDSSGRGECFTGDNVMYEWISETVPCMKQAGSDDFILTPEFISRWQQQAPAFERYLLTNGWQKQYNAQQSIDVFDVPSYDLTIGVNYAKKYGDVYCNLSIAYTASQPDPHKVWAEESCEHDLILFGGSSG